MDCCSKVGLPTLLLCKLLAQYFEKEIYIGMCTFHHKPFSVKPQGFLRLTAKTQEKILPVQGNPDFTLQARTVMGHKTTLT